MKQYENPIDFVVLWVDDSDPVWRQKKAEHTGTEEQEGNSDVRYREWNTLKYWFRGVEKFAPWVRYIYFVTDNQKPEWLNLDHPKLKWVKHTDFIPAEYLPTFNSNTIDWNLHRIDGLADRFVYFNDDMFLIRNVKPEDFFRNSLPCDLPVLGPLYADGFFSYMMFNNMQLLNRHFSLKKSIRTHFAKWIKDQPLSGIMKLAIYGRRDKIPFSVSWHVHVSYNKENFRKLWDEEYDLIHATCKNKLRTKEDITTWCIRDWQLLSGQFWPQKPVGRCFHTATMRYSDEAINYLKNQKGKVICLNDTEDETSFEEHKRMILAEFEKILPEKSAFEK